MRSGAWDRPIDRCRTERRKGEGPLPTAGIRTFTATSLVGAVSIIVGGECCLRLRPRGSSY